jgi:hypothetical protein
MSRWSFVMESINLWENFASVSYRDNQLIWRTEEYFRSCRKRIK